MLLANETHFILKITNSVSAKFILHFFYIYKWSVNYLKLYSFLTIYRRRDISFDFITKKKNNS